MTLELHIMIAPLEVINPGCYALDLARPHPATAQLDLGDHLDLLATMGLITFVFFVAHVEALKLLHGRQSPVVVLAHDLGWPPSAISLGSPPINITLIVVFRPHYSQLVVGYRAVAIVGKALPSKRRRQAAYEQNAYQAYVQRSKPRHVYTPCARPLPGAFYAAAGASARGLLGHCIRKITPKTARPMRYIQKRFSWATPSQLAIASGRIKMKVAANKKGNS